MRDAALPPRFEPRVLVELGRVSNLPTVWSNVLAGMVLAGGGLAAPGLALVLLAGSALYVGGMFLNDAFDADIDARERPERPIPSGRIARATVFAIGFGLLGLGVLLLAAVSAAAAVAGAALAGTIVLYDAWHKGNPLGPLVMGLCRVLLYLVAGYAATAAPDGALFFGAAALLAYLIGLTYVAKQERIGAVRTLWPLGFLAVPFLYALPAPAAGLLPALLYAGLALWVLHALRFVLGTGRRDVPRTVVSLIAGIALLDALLLAWAGAPGLALAAVLCFALTLAGQRWVRGT